MKYRSKKQKRKAKNKNYNKLFSYKNADRRGRNFEYKNFAYSDTYRTIFVHSKFLGNNFHRAKFKYCNFNGCLFQFIEFSSVNFRGSKFKGARFENVVFDSCVFSNANIQNAVFHNVYFINSSIKNTGGQPVLENVQAFNFKECYVEVKQDMIESLRHCEKNSYIYKSGTLHSNKKGTVYFINENGERIVYPANGINILRLLDNFSSEEIEQALNEAAEKIAREFSSLSYFLPYFKKKVEKNQN